MKSTEQERASLSSFIDRAGRDGFDTAHNFFDCGEVVFFNHATVDLWNFWQAARRAPAVPQGWKLVPMEPTPEQLLKVYKQTGVSRKELADLWTAMLAAAPQPPEAEGLMSEKRTTKPDAAPVQLPEYGIDTANHAGIRVRGYTEQQVRQLLAAKGKND